MDDTTTNIHIDGSYDTIGAPRPHQINNDNLSSNVRGFTTRRAMADEDDRNNVRRMPMGDRGHVAVR